MNPIVQGILAVGVLALVGMGGFVMVYGVPPAALEVSALDRLTSAHVAARDPLCRANLSRPLSELTEAGRAERLRCLARK